MRLHFLSSLVSGFYYGINAGVSRGDAQSICQSMGLRMAVLETQAEYEEAKTFLQQYESLWGSVMLYLK